MRSTRRSSTLTRRSSRPNFARSTRNALSGPGCARRAPQRHARARRQSRRWSRGPGGAPHAPQDALPRPHLSAEAEQLLDRVVQRLRLAQACQCGPASCSVATERGGLPVVGRTASVELAASNAGVIGAKPGRLLAESRSLVSFAPQRPSWPAGWAGSGMACAGSWVVIPHPSFEESPTGARRRPALGPFPFSRRGNVPHCARVVFPSVTR